MTTYTSLDEANREIEDLNARLTGAMNASAAKGRLLNSMADERDLLIAQNRGRGEMIEALTAELGRARDLLREGMQELLTISRLAGAKIPASIVDAAKSAGFDVG